MIIPYNVSSDWSRESRDCANKTSCLPGKNIISHLFGSLVIFHTKLVIRTTNEHKVNEV